MGNKSSDATISTADLTKIHNGIARNGVNEILHDVAERESALAAYVLCAGFQISEDVRRRGAPDELVNGIKDDITARMLVVIEAQHHAHQELWRDFLPEPEAPKSGPKPKGDGDGSTK